MKFYIFTGYYKLGIKGGKSYQKSEEISGWKIQRRTPRHLSYFPGSFRQFKYFSLINMSSTKIYFWWGNQSGENLKQKQENLRKNVKPNVTETVEKKKNAMVLTFEDN